VSSIDCYHDSAQLFLTLLHYIPLFLLVLVCVVRLPIAVGPRFYHYIPESVRLHVHYIIALKTYPWYRYPNDLFTIHSIHLSWYVTLTSSSL